MDSALKLYLRKLDDAIAVIESCEICNSLMAVGEDGLTSLSGSEEKLSEIAMTLRGHLRSNRQIRTYDYHLIIVMLYGALEQFVEMLASACAQQIASAARRYEHIPDGMKDRHLRQSLNVMQNIDMEKHSSYNLEEIVKNLNSCLNGGTEPFRINHKVFGLHGANIRPDMLRDILAGAGIENVTAHIVADAEFSTYMKERIGLADHVPLRQGQAFETLIDLAQRRNMVSHGVDDDDLLSLGVLREYCDYMKRFGTTLTRISTAQAKHIVAQIEADNYAEPLPEPVNVINNEIGCFVIKGMIMEVGDMLFARTEGGSDIRFGPILEMQVEGNSVPRVDATLTPVGVGLRVGFYIKHNHKYYWLRRR